MLTLTEIFAIIVIHWIADFIFQDEKWALGKSKNWADLFKHTSTYMWFWFLMWYFLPYHLTLLFMVITFVAHTATDYVTSRIVSKMFKENKLGSPIPNLGAFTMIGFDQILHYVQLFLTYYLLKTI